MDATVGLKARLATRRLRYSQYVSVVSRSIDGILLQFAILLAHVSLEDPLSSLRSTFPPYRSSLSVSFLQA